MSEEIERLIRLGRYDKAIVALRARSGAPVPEVFDVDEAMLGHLVAQAVAKLIASVPLLVDEMVTTAINRARGRAD